MTTHPSLSAPGATVNSPTPEGPAMITSAPTDFDAILAAWGEPARCEDRAASSYRLARWTVNE